MLLSNICVVSVLALALFTSTVSGAYCSGSPKPGVYVNDYPIFDEKLTHIRSVKNGMLFEAGPPNARFPVVHVWGTPYEVGFAQGTIRKEAVIEFITKLWAYLNTELTPYITNERIPQWLKDIIVSRAMDRALDWSRSVTEEFTPQAYKDELRGIADATGLSYDLLYRINMFPELSKAQCSMFGAWGTAVGKEGASYQLRALDFDTDGPFKDYPQVTVYHPSEGHAYAQVGWPGSIGALTGFSSQQLAISEIGVSFPDDSFGQGTYPNTPPEKVRGEPWMFILRDILQFETSLASAEHRITTANRTCNLILGLGDGKANGVKVNGVQFSGHVANYYWDNNLLPVNETWHVPIPDIVYNGMDWLCPAYNQVLGDQLRTYHGQIDEIVTIRNILPTVQTGDLHIAVYDLQQSNLHVSFCRGENADPNEPHYAYQRQFTRLHMTDLFAVPPPSVV